MKDEDMQELALLDAEFRELMPRALEGDAAAADRVLDIKHRRNQILGLYPAGADPDLVDDDDDDDDDFADDDDDQ